MLLVQFLAQYFIMALALDKQQGWIQDFRGGGGGGGAHDYGKGEGVGGCVCPLPRKA